MKKGAVGMPMEVMVGIVLAAILILIALVMFGVIPGLGGQQTARGNFESCCIAYNIAGNCAEGAADANFECSVDKSVSSTGKMKLSEVAASAGLSIENCCKK